MLTRFLLVLVALTLLSGSLGFAQPETYMVYGEGQKSCGSWVADTDARPSSNMRANDRVWVLGFVSGVGYRQTWDPPKLGELKATDSNALTVWMDNYCRAHPLDSIVKGASALVTELASQK